MNNIYSGGYSAVMAESQIMPATGWVAVWLDSSLPRGWDSAPLMCWVTALRHRKYPQPGAARDPGTWDVVGMICLPEGDLIFPVDQDCFLGYCREGQEVQTFGKRVVAATK
jgi:hypothetical protein